jgi:hypothetical protein
VGCPERRGGVGVGVAGGWLRWCYDLRTRPVAIICFRDHIEGNVYRTADGNLYETLAAAQDHRRRSFAELCRDHAVARVINGVLIGEDGAQTWEVVDPERDNLTGYGAFIWHDSTIGLNHRTESLDEAVAFNAEQAKVLEQTDAADATAGIERSIVDESGAFSVWVRKKLPLKDEKSILNR